MQDDTMTPSPAGAGSGGERFTRLTNARLHFKVLSHKVPDLIGSDSGARLWLGAGGLVPLPLGLPLFSAAPACLAIGESVGAHGDPSGCVSLRPGQDAAGQPSPTERQSTTGPDLLDGRPGCFIDTGSVYCREPPRGWILMAICTRERP
jgi:hypothetical protein